MKLGTIRKRFVSTKGNSVVFRYLEKSDLDDMLVFVNQLIDEDTFIEMCGKKLTRDEEVKHLNVALEDIENGRKIYVTVLVNGQYAGNGVLRIGELRHTHVAEIGISLVSQLRDEGIGTELLNTLIIEAKAIGLRLLTLNCFENNPRALHVYEKAGFKRSGVIPGALNYKGGFVGEVKLYMSLFR